MGICPGFSSVQDRNGNVTIHSHINCTALNSNQGNIQFKISTTKHYFEEVFGQAELKFGW